MVEDHFDHAIQLAWVRAEWLSHNPRIEIGDGELFRVDGWAGRETESVRATDPGMSLLTSVEYITSDPARRIALYRCCSPEDRSTRSSGMGQDDPRLLKIASSVAKDLALLERRAKAEGFHV